MDAVRARIAPLFPDWTAESIEVLVCQIAAVEWRYSIGSEPTMADGAMRSK